MKSVSAGSSSAAGSSTSSSSSNPSASGVNEQCITTDPVRNLTTATLTNQSTTTLANDLDLSCGVDGRDDRTACTAGCRSNASARAAAESKEFDRIAMVDVQPHYFGGSFDRVDLVIDHHPEQPGAAVFRDIRADYGSTSTILTEHLRAVDANISERTATAMLYAIKSDTLFFNRQTNRVDIEAFSYLYPLADAALIRKMEGSEITAERLEYVMKAYQEGALVGQVFCGSIGTSPREDLIPYIADFFLQLENVKWTIVAGIVGETLIVSVRNLGYSRDAGEFVRRYFSDVGNAGGHRAMAKAVVPMAAFRKKYGDLDARRLSAMLHAFAAEFLHDPAREVKGQKIG